MKNKATKNTKTRIKAKNTKTRINYDIKKDNGKLRMDLVPPEWLLEASKVLTFGLQKGYKENSWRDVEINRYIASTHRHLNAFQMGELTDPESGLSHLSHLLTNVGFLLSLTRKS